jgi:Tfp pilus assembly protein PilV
MSRLRTKKLKLSNQSGMSLIETTISSGILLFILSSSFLVINTTISTSSVVERKVELSQRLDAKIDRYLVTGRFNAAPVKSNEFKQVQSSNPKIAKFEAKDNDFNVKISKEVLTV